MKTILFGGSFNPIHIGHAMIANYVSQLEEDCELWLMPGRVNPLKTGHRPEADSHRLAMCRMVADRCRNVKVCDAELSLPEPSYTWQTLQYLTERYPGRTFALLIGSDNWLCFDRWRNHEEILDRYELMVYPRPGYDVAGESLPRGVRLLQDLPTVNMSSTFVREGLAQRRDMSFFVPRDVLEYIKKQRLYE